MFYLEKRPYTMLDEQLPIIHQAHFRIRAYDIDSRKQATIPALVRLMQEAAMEQVVALGISVWDLDAHHISWILMRKHLEIKRIPKHGEAIRIMTHPSGFERIFTYRDFRVFDAQDNLIAHSSTAWILMNTQTRKLARIPDFILSLGDKLPPETVFLPKVETHIPKMKQPQWETPFRVSWHDLDFNQHLNNTYYIQWMLDSLPQRVLQYQQIKEMSVQYQAEALLGERLLSQACELSEKRYAHRLIREEDGKELACLVTQWV